jgi:preprotein translocase subunit SecY
VLGRIGLFNMFSGGALSRFTIFALGIMPYISASIIMQLMTAVSAKLDQLRKEANPAAARSRSTRATARCSLRCSRRPASPSPSSRRQGSCSSRV